MSKRDLNTPTNLKKVENNNPNFYTKIKLKTTKNEIYNKYRKKRF